MTGAWDDLSDGELAARIVARGATAEQARIVVAHRDSIDDDVVTAWLGEP